MKSSAMRILVLSSEVTIRCSARKLSESEPRAAVALSLSVFARSVEKAEFNEVRSFSIGVCTPPRRPMALRSFFQAAICATSLSIATINVARVGAAGAASAGVKVAEAANDITAAAVAIDRLAQVTCRQVLSCRLPSLPEAHRKLRGSRRLQRADHSQMSGARLAEMWLGRHRPPLCPPGGPR